MKNKKSALFTTPVMGLPCDLYASVASIPFYIRLTHPSTPLHGFRFFQENVPGIDILENPSRKEYENKLSEGYDILGISFFTRNVPVVIEMVKIAREYGVKEIWGGNYGVMTPEIDKYFDRVFWGYCEHDVNKALGNKPIKKLKHPVVCSDSGLGALVLRRTGYLYTTRGCPLKCTFCPTVTFTKPDEIELSEIRKALEKYKEQGVDFIYINDECFLINKKHGNAVVDMLGELEFNWMCLTRADLLKGRMHELADKGLKLATIGIESLNEKNLKSIKKRQEVNTIRDTCQEADDNDVLILGTYMLCCENDTPASIMRDAEELATWPILGSLITILTPFPNTPLWEKMRSKIIDWDWAHYDENHLVWKHPHITPEKAIELQDAVSLIVNEPIKVTKKIMQKALGMMKRDPLRHVYIDLQRLVPFRL